MAFEPPAAPKVRGRARHLYRNPAVTGGKSGLAFEHVRQTWTMAGLLRQRFPVSEGGIVIVPRGHFAAPAGAGRPLRGERAPVALL